MKFCILDSNNVCVNIIEALEADPLFLSGGQSYPDNHDGQIGWVYQDGQWTDPRPVNIQE